MLRNQLCNRTNLFSVLRSLRSESQSARLTRTPACFQHASTAAEAWNDSPNDDRPTSGVSGHPRPEADQSNHHKSNNGRAEETRPKLSSRAKWYVRRYLEVQSRPSKFPRKVVAGKDNGSKENEREIHRWLSAVSPFYAKLNPLIDGLTSIEKQLEIAETQWMTRCILTDINMHHFPNTSRYSVIQKVLNLAEMANKRLNNLAEVLETTDDLEYAEAMSGPILIRQSHRLSSALNRLLSKLKDLPTDVESDAQVKNAELAAMTALMQEILADRSKAIEQNKTRLVSRRKYDGKEQMNDFKGDEKLPILRLVRRGKISLEQARVSRFYSLIGLLGSIEDATKQIRVEDMMPKDYDTALKSYKDFIARKAEAFRRNAETIRAKKNVMPEIKEFPPPLPEDTLCGSDAPQVSQQQQTIQNAAAYDTPTSTSASLQQLRQYSTLTRVLLPSTQHRYYTTSSKPSEAPSPNRPFTKKDPTWSSPRRSTFKARSHHPPNTTSSPSSATPTSSTSSKPKPHRPPPYPTPPTPSEPEGWRIQKSALHEKFPQESGGWSPRRKLSPDAMLHLRQLHLSNPTFYTTPLLASTFKTSPEAIRRILKSKWLTNVSSSDPNKMRERRERWAKRHDRIWDVKSELGLRPKRDKEKGVEDGMEKVESELESREVLRRGREENPVVGDRWRDG